MKKRFALLTLVSLFTLMFSVSFAAAACVDEDQDRYYSDDGEGCTKADLPLGNKGIEERRCDFATIDIEDIAQPDANKVYNPDIAGATIQGNKINPGTIEKADNGVDENCDGEDGKLIAGDDGNNKDLADIITKAITILSGLAGIISALIITYGGILWATAAGEEEKIQKAKKAIIGAIIGAVIALSAYFIVNYFVEKFV